MIYLTITSLVALVVIGATSAALFVFVGREQRTERDQWANERRELLNRIKPETAQYSPSEQVTNPPVVGFDDDEDFWSTMELTKEELADRAMQQELNGGRDR